LTAFHIELGEAHLIFEHLVLLAWVTGFTQTATVVAYAGIFWRLCSRRRVFCSRLRLILDDEYCEMEHQAASIGMICPKGTGRVSVEAQRTG
jgi:hypothetical protein